jgi:hypothetical protein
MIHMSLAKNVLLEGLYQAKGIVSELETIGPGAVPGTAEGVQLHTLTFKKLYMLSYIFSF